MSDIQNRRAQKKAETHELIRAVAQSLFAERGFDDVTIADIARAADVAVQTVFNHFADARKSSSSTGARRGSQGPADGRAVAGSPRGAADGAARYLVDLVGHRVGSRGEAERQRYLATLEASDALVHPGARTGPRDREPPGRGAARGLARRGRAVRRRRPRLSSPPPSGWPTIRVIIIDRRVSDPTGTDPQAMAADLCALTDAVLRQLETSLPSVALAAAARRRRAPPRPPVPARRVARPAGRASTDGGRRHERQQDLVDDALDLLGVHRAVPGGRVALPPERLEHRAEQRQPVRVDRLAARRGPGAELGDRSGERLHQRLRRGPAAAPPRAGRRRRGWPRPAPRGRAAWSSARPGRSRSPRSEPVSSGDGDQGEPADGVPGERGHRRPAPVDAGLAGARPGGDAVAVEPAPALLGQDVDRDREQLLGQLGAQRPPGCRSAGSVPSHVHRDILAVVESPQ